MNKYVSEFLSLKCSADVLKVCNPLGKKTQKEITESIGIIKRLKPLVIKHPMKYTLYDFCAGNALTSIIAIYLLPIKSAIAIDIRKRERDWDKVNRFTYKFEDIYKFDISKIEENSIIISVHACSDLSEKIIDIYNKSKATYLILMPCCIGKLNNKFPQIFRTKLGKYTLWCWHLMEKCKGKNIMREDKNILSPKNIIIISKKEEQDEI